MKEDLQVIYDFLHKTNTYYLATYDGVSPRVRPFGTINLYQNKLYFQTGKVKKVAEELKNDPHIEICAFDGTDWIRISAEAYLDDSLDARIDMLDKYPSLKAMYQPDDGNTEVYYLKNGVATIYSFTHENKIYHIN